MKHASGIHDATDPTGSFPGVEIRVVNLARAQDRRRIMQDQFDRLSLGGAIFQTAVDAARADQKDRIAALPDAGPWGPFRPHDKGCTLSHLDLLRAFLEGPASHCLVLEDDLHLSSDLPGWLADLGWWPRDADLVKIERWRDDRLFLVLGRPPRRHLGRSIGRLLSRHTGAGGYIVTREGAHKIIDHAPVDMPIDHLLFNMNVSPLARRLVIHQVWPALVQQGNEPPQAPQTAPAVPQRSRTSRVQHLRRGLHEARILPRLLAQVLRRRATVARIDWRDRAAQAAAT